MEKQQEINKNIKQIAKDIDSKKENFSSIARKYNTSHTTVRRKYNQYKKDEQKKRSIEQKKVQKNRSKNTKKKTSKSTLAEQKELIKYKWDLESRKDKYIIIDKLIEYKNAHNNKSFRLTQKCLEYLDYPKKDVRIILKNMIKGSENEK
jgi:hypothetical protein